MPLLFPADAGVCEDPPSEAALHETSVSLSASDFAEWIEERAGVTLARRLISTLSRFIFCSFVCFLTAPYQVQAPHLVHKMLVLKDVVVFRFPTPRVLYGWILQFDLTLPCDLEWLLAGR